MIIFTLVALAAAHVRLWYEPAKMPIRNANGQGDGTFSTSGDGCGDAGRQYGANGITRIAVGTEVKIMFDYGTGVSGDHKDPNNVFQVAFVDLAKTTQAKMFADTSLRISPPIPAPEGSNPNHINVTVKIPYVCEKCFLAVFDQRQWGGCIDLKVVESLEIKTDFSNELGWLNPDALFGISETDCKANPNLKWSMNYSALDSGFKGAPAHCCPAKAFICGQKCWLGPEPDVEYGINVFKDGSTCKEETFCNGTKPEALCSYRLNGAITRKCVESCSSCDNLCEASAGVGYKECRCIGSGAVAQSVLAVFVASLAAVVALF